MDQTTRKLMTMQVTLHPRDDIDRLYASGKEGGRGLANIEDSNNVSIQRLEDYIKKGEEKLITAANNSTDSIRTNRTATKTRKKKWDEKQLYRYFKRQTVKISNEKT